MICHVVIHDFEISRRMVYVLDDVDFKIWQNIRNDTDEVLSYLQNYDLFTGRTRWCDLDIKHFHVMIVNTLKMLGNMDDTVRGDKANPLVMRLSFFLCALVTLLEERTGSTVDLIRVNRISDDDVLYDYSATLDVEVKPIIKTGLKVVK